MARAGFPLDHPYLEQCYLPALGPTAIALLRKAHRLTQHQNPTRLPFDELAASLGINGESLRNTIQRLKGYRFAPTQDGWWKLTVFDRCPPLSQRLLDKVPPSARAAHERLLDDHLQTFARGHQIPDHQAATTAFTSRLDRLQRQSLSIPELGR